MTRGRKFMLDRVNGKLMGVCAGIGRALDVDPLFVRVGFVVATLWHGFPWTLIAYGVLAWVGGRNARHRKDGALAAPTPRASAAEMRDSMRDLDRRMAEVETFVTSPNQSLAHEIESLRQA
jgi:phage shock protein C